MNRALKHPLMAFSAILLRALVGMLYADTNPLRRSVKKLIEYGWDVPYPYQVRKDIRNMEKKPFGGIIFRL